MRDAVPFGTLNTVVLAVYLAGLLAIGWRLARRQRTTEDFFLAGRNLPWWPVAMSMYASVTSAMTFLGLPGMAYAENASLLVVGLVSPLVAPLLIVLFYPVYRRMGVATSYEYIARRFGPGARYAVSLLFLLTRMCWLGTVVYAPAMALSVVTGMPLWAAILLMGVLATAYTALGGLSAVVWTDVVQFVLMIGGAAWMAVALIRFVPGGAPAILAHARAAGHLQPGDWRFNPLAMTSLAVSISYFLLLLHDYGVDQVTVQRLLAVRSDRGVTRAIVFNACTDFLIVGTLLFIGLGLLAYYAAYPGQLPEGLSGDRVMPYFILHRLPAGVSGLVLTAVFAAAMSSMDSGINSVAAVIVNDLAGPLRRGAAPSAGATVGAARALTVLLGGLATGLAFFAQRIGGIVKTFLTFMGLFAAPVLALFLLGMLLRRARFAPWLAGTLAAVPLTWAAQRYGWMHEIWLFPFSFSLTFTAGALGSAFAPRRARPAGAG